MAGGKAVGLGGLIQAGLPVPPGFVLTTAAYSRFVTDYEDASERIRALFESGIIPDGIASKLTKGYGWLDGDRDAPVAVRSSATAEDLASASFAGKQET